MKAENNALRGAELFWVARDMVDVSVDAASTLPDTRTGDHLTVGAAVLGQTRRHGALRAETGLDHRCAVGRA